VLNPATRGGRVWPLLPIAGAGDFADGHATDVRSIEVLGDTAVAFTLTEPLAIFPKFLAMPVASVVPAAVPADFGQRPVGTGPWRFVAWEHDDFLRFAKNPSYWGDVPQAESLTVRIIPEDLTRAAEFLAVRDQGGAWARRPGDSGAAGHRRHPCGDRVTRRVQHARSRAQGRHRHGDPRLVGGLPGRRQLPLPAVPQRERRPRRQLFLL